MPSTVIQRNFLPLSSVQLGRFVLNVDEPHSDYQDPSSDVISSTITNPHTGYNRVQRDASGGGLAATLTRLVSASRRKHNSGFTQVASEQVLTYQLNNSGLWFKRAIADKDLRQWIIEAIQNGDDVYMIVGYYTMLNARVFEGGNTLSESSLQLEVPVTASLAAGGVTLPIGSDMDPSFGADRRQDQQVQTKFVAPGEQICAVQYRKLQFKWYSSRDLDKASLAENRWQVFLGMRGQEPEINDVLEADLQEKLELDSQRENESSEDGEIFFF